MISYIALTNHKALKSIQGLEFGQINIICGKNNSGKTTVLEALCRDGCYGIGKKINDADVNWLCDLFKQQADRYDRPSPEHSKNWFRNHMEGLAKKNTIWFSDDSTNIIQGLHESQRNDSYLNRFGQAFEYDSILKVFFSKDILYFNPLLIPPKRRLDFQVVINLNQEITPEGLGITNKLFYLKNQDLNSEDYLIFKNIYDTFFEITGSRFNIVPNKSNEISLLYNTDGNWIPASDSGLGLSDVLIMVSILNIQTNNVFLIEEPENHLHAEYQRKLLKYLRSKKSKQFFITTHSSVFLDTSAVDKIFYCTNNQEIRLSDQTTKSEIINSLGYSVTENLVADLLVLLEGPTDIPVIKQMLSWLGVDSTYNVRFWPLGGDIMATLDLSVLSERNNVFALIDSDPKSSVQRTRFMRNCKKNGVHCHKLERYSIENYLTLAAVKKVFPKQVPHEIETISPNELVDAQIKFKEKNKSIKAKNEQIVQNMSLSDIEGTDLLDFLVSIKEFLSKNSPPQPLGG